jgi:hypothetical protein
VHVVRTLFLIGVMVAPWFTPLAFADLLTTRGGVVFEGTLVYQDTSIVKFRLNSTSEINVFMRADVANIQFSGPPRAVAAPQLEVMAEVGEAEWERRGENDGESSTGMKSLLAGGGGCCLGTGTGLLFGIPTFVTAAGGGSVGCLGGWGAAHIGQQPPKPPTEDRIGREAYLRGFERGLRRSNNTAMLVGTGATILAIIGTAFVVGMNEF